MEKIYQHIEKLLAQHDYAVVPGLGGFVVQMQSAECQDDCINPPCATLAFNPLMQHTDGLLVLEIAKASGITYREANQFLEREINQFHLLLHQEKVASAGNLGTFKLEGTNIVFKPSPSLDFLPHNFGLTSVYITPIWNKKKDVITIKIPAFEWKKAVAIATLIIGLAAFNPINDNIRNTNSASLTSFVNTIKENQRKVELLQKSDSIIAPTEEAIDIESNLVNNTPSTPIENADKKSFHVIVGSWSGEKSANHHCQILKDQHYNDVHVVHPDRGYFIAIQSFGNREEAIEYMKTIRKSEKKFSSAWVLCEE